VQPLHPRGRGRRPAAARPGARPADVTAIELGVATPVLRTIAEPPEAKARPASGYHAAFSGPYTVAAALLGGGLGVSHEDFTDAAARDPRRLALAALVRCVEDERCSASFPHAFPAVLRVTTRTGEELEARVEVNRGGPGNPLSDEELARKFHDNAVRSLPEERAAELAARTLALPDAQSVEDLTALLTSAGER
jgi:2-methylcitrate dehydratase PrpD